MTSTPFNTETDKASIPFTKEACQFAKRSKLADLKWQPHVGCFVWDESNKIKVASPFPNNIYFILNLGHFEKILGSIEEVKNAMIWLPTWHQARLLCNEFDIPHQIVYDAISSKGNDVLTDILELYRLILNELTQ